MKIPFLTPSKQNEKKRGTICVDRRRGEPGAKERDDLCLTGRPEEPAAARDDLRQLGDQANQAKERDYLRRTATSPNLLKLSYEPSKLQFTANQMNCNQVSLENGTVAGFDIRTAISASSSESKPNFTLYAHDKAVCAISYNPVAPNRLATTSSDRMVKLWDLSNNQPSCIASQNPKAGAVFSVSFSEDSSFLLVMGGSKGNLELWDTLSDAGISRRYWKYAKQKSSI